MKIKRSFVSTPVTISGQRTDKIDFVPLGPLGRKILQDFYGGQIPYEEIAREIEAKYFRHRIGGMTYVRPNRKPLVCRPRSNSISANLLRGKKVSFRGQLEQ